MKTPPFGMPPLSKQELTALLEQDSEQWTPSREAEQRVLRRLSATLGVPLALQGPPPLPAHAISTTAQGAAEVAGSAAASSSAGMPVASAAGGGSAGAAAGALGGSVALIKPLLLGAVVGAAVAVGVGHLVTMPAGPPRAVPVPTPSASSSIRVSPAPHAADLVAAAPHAARTLSSSRVALGAGSSPQSGTNVRQGVRRAGTASDPQSERRPRRSPRVGRVRAAAAGSASGGESDGSFASPPDRAAGQMADGAASSAASAPVVVQSQREAAWSLSVPVAPEPMRPQAAPSRSAPPEPEMPPHASDSRFSLAAERRLLDSAHLALVHADPSRAAQALQRHAERFGARGLLNEEAQALRVRLLAALGKRARAAEAAQEFFRRYPNSLLRAVVESALQGRARRPR